MVAFSQGTRLYGGNSKRSTEIPSREFVSITTNIEMMSRLLTFGRSFPNLPRH